MVVRASDDNGRPCRKPDVSAAEPGPPASRAFRRFTRWAQADGLGAVADAWAARLLRPHGVTLLRCDVQAVDAGARGQANAVAVPHALTIVVVAYRQPMPLLCLLASLASQSRQNFDVIVLHDGPHAPSREVVERFAAMHPAMPMRYIETEQRHNDYGHTLRDMGIKMAQGEFLLVTNGDNGYGPRTLEYAFAAIEQDRLDLVMWDMVHSHANPGGTGAQANRPFTVFPLRLRSDVGAFIVRTARARQVGFRDRSHDGDATYLEDLLYRATPRPVRVGLVHRTLLMHN
jgi:hypothetical protein